MSNLRGVCCSAVRLSGLSRDVPIAAAHAVKHNRFAAPAGRLRFRPEIELNRLPSIAVLRLRPGLACCFLPQWTMPFSQRPLPPEPFNTPVPSHSLFSGNFALVE